MKQKILDDVVNITLASDFNLRLATGEFLQHLSNLPVRHLVADKPPANQQHEAYKRCVQESPVSMDTIWAHRMDIAPFVARLPVHSMEPVLARIKALDFHVCRSILDQGLRFQRFSIQRANDSVDSFQLILELVLGYVEQVDCATLVMLRLRHIWARRQGAFERQYVECLVGAFEERFRDHLAQLSTLQIPILHHLRCCEAWNKCFLGSLGLGTALSYGRLKGEVWRCLLAEMQRHDLEKRFAFAERLQRLSRGRQADKQTSRQAKATIARSNFGRYWRIRCLSLGRDSSGHNGATPTTYCDPVLVL
ncbi:hypothetical protein KC367_g93 [Hortaea werneckii]|nr:hypothetical protein KC367_g93 [Hortaea werneckii]